MDFGSQIWELFSTFHNMTVIVYYFCVISIFHLYLLGFLAFGLYIFSEWVVSRK